MTHPSIAIPRCSVIISLAAMVPMMEDGMPTEMFDLDVDRMSEEEQCEWANDVMVDADPIAKALDIMGWKIVCKDADWGRWPFDSERAGCASPEWCEDLSERKPDLQ